MLEKYLESEADIAHVASEASGAALVLRRDGRRLGGTRRRARTRLHRGRRLAGCLKSERSSSIISREAGFRKDSFGISELILVNKNE